MIHSQLNETTQNKKKASKIRNKQTEANLLEEPSPEGTHELFFILLLPSISIAASVGG
jgi:hypothetical protein